MCFKHFKNYLKHNKELNTNEISRMICSISFKIRIEQASRDIEHYRVTW